MRLGGVSAASAVLPALGEGGWAASKFHDVSMETWFGEFVEMYKRSGVGSTSAFTDRKLRVLHGWCVDAPTMP